MKKALYDIEKFDGTDYLTWRARMKLLLQCEKLWSHVKGRNSVMPVVEDDEDDDLLQEWIENDNKAQAMIQLSLNNEQFQHVRECTTARIAWKTLKKVHMKKGAVNELIIRHKLTSMQKLESETIEQYLCRVRSVARELRAIGGQLPDKDIISIILKGLPIEYIDVSSSILRGDVGSIAQAVNDLRAHESLLAMKAGNPKTQRCPLVSPVRNKN